MATPGATPAAPSTTTDSDKLEMGDGNKLEDRVKTAKDVTDKENRDGHKSLTRAKGRGQVTATTAMSVVNVALLKSVLDRGPDDNKYYEVILVLISVSLALQILAGLMCLVIEQTLGYLSKYGGNFCDDAAVHCCPWRCVKNTLREHEHDSQGGTTFIKRSEVQEQSAWEKDDPTNCDFSSTTMLADASEDPMCGCCPFVITNQVYAQHEINTLQKFSIWRMGFVKNELSVLRGDKELSYQVTVVDESKKKLAQLTEDLKKKDADVTEINRQMTKLHQDLTKATDRKHEYQKTRRKAEIVREQGILLSAYARAIRKNRVLKQASFWQQILNYLFYAIFIMNAFITGLGLATSPNADGVTTTTMIPTITQ